MNTNTTLAPSLTERQGLCFILLQNFSRWKPWEIIFVMIMLGSWFVLSDHALLLNEIAILALFALSLDIALGYAGIISLGHAAFFGIGAYTAALFAKHIMPDPIVGLLLSMVVCAVVGSISSILLMRGSDLTRLMITLGVAALFYELANKMDDITGGADGLQGVVMGPLLGRFEFDLYGQVAYGYTLVILFIVFLFCRKLVQSPFGVGLTAIQNNRLRAESIGIRVPFRLASAYTISAAIAGLAGALSAQASGFASLDVLDFHRSADVLLVLVIGGIGWLYGGILGAVIFKVLYDLLSSWTPQYWMFWMGLFLLILVLIGRERITGWMHLSFLKKGS